MKHWSPPENRVVEAGDGRLPVRSLSSIRPVAISAASAIGWLQSGGTDTKVFRGTQCVECRRSLRARLPRLLSIVVNTTTGGGSLRGSPPYPSIPRGKVFKRRYERSPAPTSTTGEKAASIREARDRPCPHPHRRWRCRSCRVTGSARAQRCWARSSCEPPTRREIPWRGNRRVHPRYGSRHGGYCRGPERPAGPSTDATDPGPLRGGAAGRGLKQLVQSDRPERSIGTTLPIEVLT